MGTYDLVKYWWIVACEKRCGDGGECGGAGVDWRGSGVVVMSVSPGEGRLRRVFLLSAWRIAYCEKWRVRKRTRHFLYYVEDEAIKKNAVVACVVGGMGRAGFGTAASRYAARLLRAISARELWGSQAECSLPASKVAARRGESERCGGCPAGWGRCNDGCPAESGAGQWGRDFSFCQKIVYLGVK